jgi:hypothetical protein
MNTLRRCVLAAGFTAALAATPLPCFADAPSGPAASPALAPPTFAGVGASAPSPSLSSDLTFRVYDFHPCQSAGSPDCSPSQLPPPDPSQADRLESRLFASRAMKLGGGISLGVGWGITALWSFGGMLLDAAASGGGELMGQSPQPHTWAYVPVIGPFAEVAANRQLTPPERDVLLVLGAEQVLSLGVLAAGFVIAPKKISRDGPRLSLLPVVTPKSASMGLSGTF